LTSRTDALTKVDSYGYDANGNRTSHTDRNGNLIAYAYDALNRPAQVRFSAPGKGGKLTLQSTVTSTWDAGDQGGGLARRDHHAQLRRAE